MKRRRLLFALAAVALPFVARAQRKRRRVALLSATSAPHWPFLRDALEGTGIAFDVRSADGAFGELEKLASDIVRARPDVIVAHEMPAILAAARATTRIPIVMAVAPDALTGANVTGLTVDAVQVASRVLDLIREVKPNARRIAMLADADDPSNRAFLDAMNRAAARIRVPVGISRVRTAADYEAAFEYWERSLASGFVEAGGLMSYSPDARQLGRRAAACVERLLEGAKPSQIPVAPFNAFEMALNLKTARALDIELADSLVARADAIIQ